MNRRRPGARLPLHASWAMLALTIHAASASPVPVPGTGNKRSECYVGLMIDGLKPVRLDHGGTRVFQESCGDVCHYTVQLCVNERSAECTATTTPDEIFVTGPAILERPASMGCGSPGELDVRLPKKTRRNRERLTVVARNSHARPRRDRDSVTFVCTRSTSACCGDGLVTEGEECDDGNRHDGDGCDSNCTFTRCGNGARSGMEECDDGNAVDGDGCDIDCSRTRCGNSRTTSGEECDPPSPDSIQCPSGESGNKRFCDEKCTCQPIVACMCETADRNLLVLNGSDEARPCGTVRKRNTVMSLDCGKLYLGGGGTTVEPVTLPGGWTMVARATCSGMRLNLTETAAGALGEPGDRQCTSAGCLFGPPLPIVRSPQALSVCLVNTLIGGLSGSVDCSTWTTNLTLPFETTIHLTGDLLDGSAPDRPNVVGIQPCPVCDGGTCRGGPHNGLQCRPGSSGVGDAYPTSEDCPPPPPPPGTPFIPSIIASLTTDPSAPSAHRTATVMNDQNVFFGFCGNASSPTFKNPPFPCTSNEQCVAGTGTGCPDTTACDTCRQHTSGAFRNFSSYDIALFGSPPGSLTGGQPRAATLVGVFAVPPTYDQQVDAVADLPGPAAIGLPVSMQLIPECAQDGGLCNGP